MNLKRIYEYRFLGVNQLEKLVVWKELSIWIYKNHLKNAEKVLDPAGGMCEFINSIPAKEKWIIDIEEDVVRKNVNNDIKLLIGSNLDVEIPKNYFNGVFISNFLEHLKSQDEVASLLTKIYESLTSKGRIVIMGPNFKYCYKEYFDFADHSVILSELGLAEHLYGAGFEIVRIIPKFFPLSFRSKGVLPINKLIIRTYLAIPIAWRFIGKQFLVIAEKN